MKNLSRREILSTLALPAISVAVRKPEWKSSPLNLAITRPVESRKVKLPSFRLTRCTSGVKTGAGTGARTGSLGAVALAGGAALAGREEITVVPAAARVVGGASTFFSGGNSGRCHFPAEFCAQTT